MKEPGIQLPPGYMDLLQRKRYSSNTIKIYCSYFLDFKKYFDKEDIKAINYNQINDYLTQLIQHRNISASQQNQRINAIKFYYEKVLNKKREYYRISRPRKESRLPTVLTKEEVNMLIQKTKKLKHRCILMTIYSGGLRRSELINLKVENIDSQRMLMKICGAKGKKDRYTLLSERLLSELRNYYNEYHPSEWLFEGQNGGPYSATSIERHGFKNG